MTLSVQIPKPVEDRLAAKARAAGIDVPTYAARLLERDARRPTLLELSGDVFENFKQSGMIDDELAEVLEKEKHETREAKQGKPFRVNDEPKKVVFDCNIFAQALMNPPEFPLKLVSSALRCVGMNTEPEAR